MPSIMKCFLFIEKIFLFFAWTFAHSWNISEERLQHKIQQHPLTWIQDQLICAPFSSQEISQCLERLKKMQGIESAGLVRIVVEGPDIRYEPLVPLNSKQLSNLDSFLSALMKLHAICPLPPLDFCMTLAPSFDRPLLLQETSIPIFAVSKETHNKKVVLIPRLWNQNRELFFQQTFHSWDQKINKAFWRGGPTDGPYGFFDWSFRPRGHLALRSRNFSDLIDARFVPSQLSDYPIDYFKQLKLLAPFVFPQEQSIYKYLLSLDGEAAPSSFEWQLFSGSLIFKSKSNKIEWFYQGLKEGEHFISFRSDGNDLFEKLIWAMRHDNEAKTIAEKGAYFAQLHLLDEEAFVYLHHLLNRYSQLLNKQSLP